METCSFSLTNNLIWDKLMLENRKNKKWFYEKET